MGPSTYRRPDSLEFTTDPEANALNAQEPAAFLIGWLLDQQIKVQAAFAGPLKLQQRLGTLDARELARMGAERIIEACSQRPVVHRFPTNMGARIHACMEHVVEHYDGDVEQIWLGADDYDELRWRIADLPGFGAGKAPAVVATLVRRFGLEGMDGFEHDLMPYGSLSEVEHHDDLVAYQARKNAWKAQRRAERAGSAGPAS